jgi:hypothetical protein
MKIIALEESFWYEKLATEGSTVAHVRVKSAVAADWQRKLVDFTEYRLPDMDRNGVDMQVLSLTSPGIQVQPDPDIASGARERRADPPAQPIAGRQASRSKPRPAQCPGALPPLDRGAWGLSPGHSRSSKRHLAVTSAPHQARRLVYIVMTVFPSL